MSLDYMILCLNKKHQEEHNICNQEVCPETCPCPDCKILKEKAEANFDIMAQEQEIAMAGSDADREAQAKDEMERQDRQDQEEKFERGSNEAP